MPQCLRHDNVDTGPASGLIGGVTDVWIAGAGMTRFGKREESLPALMAEASALALADAGIERPGSIVVAAMNPEEFTGEGIYGSPRHAPRLSTCRPSAWNGDVLRHGGCVRGLCNNRLRPPGLRARGGWREDDASAHAARLGDHRALDRCPRAQLWLDDAGAGRAHHSRGDAAPRAHPQGDLPGRRQEPRARRAEPVRALPGARRARNGDGEPARRRSPAALPLLPDVGRGSRRGAAGRAGAGAHRGNWAGDGSIAIRYRST